MRESNEYLLSAPGGFYGEGFSRLVFDAYTRVCRRDFSAPGFCLIDLGPAISSAVARTLLVSIKGWFQEIYRDETGRELQFISLERFDQQQTTKFHVDGAPEESLLMLGYEPSEIVSEVAIADYSRCAHAMGLTPLAFLEKHNPMFAPGAELLRPYVTPLSGFKPENHQLLLINNSSAAYSETGGGWQGVMHTATITAKDESKRRVINSALAGVFAAGAVEGISAEEQERFKTTTRVRRKGYDKPDLKDDE